MNILASSSLGGYRLREHLKVGPAVAFVVFKVHAGLRVSRLFGATPFVERPLHRLERGPVAN